MAGVLELSLAGKWQAALDPEEGRWMRMGVRDRGAGGCTQMLAHSARGDHGIHAAVPLDRTFVPDTWRW